MYTENRITRRLRMATVLIGLFGFVFSNAASALQYRKDLPMVITYKNDYGNWNGCGPVQCTVSSWDTERRVVDLVTHDDHGTFQHIGSVGRCNVYQSGGELESYENQPDEVANRVNDFC